METKEYLSPLKARSKIVELKFINYESLKYKRWSLSEKLEILQNCEENGTFRTILFGTVSGGLSAELTGGNFWQCAANGLVVSALNHVAHSFRNFGNNTIVAGIYGAGDKGLMGNSNFRELVESKGGKLFKSSSPLGDNGLGNDGDFTVIEYLTEGYNAGKSIEIYGYSRGGAAAIRIANKLGSRNINILKLFTFDAHNLFPFTQYGSFSWRGEHTLRHNNVGMAVNFYQHNTHMNFLDNPFLGARVVSKYINVINKNLTYSPVSHNNIINCALTNFNFGL